MATGKKFIDLTHVLKVQTLLKDQQTIGKLCQDFTFQQELKMEGNLNVLSEILKSILQIEGESAELLKAFLVESNIPIEVTLRPLRPNHLSNLLEEWLKLTSSDAHSNNHFDCPVYRNALFRTIFSEQSQTINDYFSLNQKNVLIADDIFNLLQQILAQYFLYDSEDDIQTFFEKENALLNFKNIVQRFSTYSNRSKERQYIKQEQLQNLIQFWQGINPNLVLSDTPRKCIKNSSIQTDQCINNDLQVQATEGQLTFIDILNSTLAKLNAATAQCSSPKDLEVIGRIYSYLKHEKQLLIGHGHSQNEQALFQLKDKYKFSIQKKYLEIDIKASQSFTTFTPKQSPNITQIHEKKINTSKHSTMLSSRETERIKPEHLTSKEPFQNCMRKTDIHYKGDDNFTVTTLQRFLTDIRLTQKGEIVKNLIKKGLLRNVLQISFQQFMRSVEWISYIQPSFNKSILQENLINHSKNRKEKITSKVQDNSYKFKNFVCSRNNPYGF